MVIMQGELNRLEVGIDENVDPGFMPNGKTIGVRGLTFAIPQTRQILPPIHGEKPQLPVTDSEPTPVE